MPRYSYEWMEIGLQVTWLAFVVMFACCLGSLINVLVYRLPRGLGVVTPPSRCPACETKLTWRENVPVLGWILLKGKCRFCKSKISAEYPIVEAFVGLLIGGFFVLWYLVPADALQVSWYGMKWSAIRPDWFLNPPSRTWPEFIVVALLLGSLVAMTLVDAKTFTIPLELAWVAAAIGIVIHPLHAAIIEYSGVRLAHPDAQSGWVWAIATPRSWWWLGASIGGSVGLGLSLLLLRAGLIRRSFADYEEWEQKTLAAEAAALAGKTAEPGDGEGGHAGPEMWTQYPHARREMFKEIVFLAAPISLGVLAGMLAQHYLATNVATGRVGINPPLWLQVLGGVLLGYLVGGGVVWATRVGGSLGFGREAMGLGDVHLMAAVGACLGWIDSVLAFFGAAFVGLIWTLAGSVFGGGLKRHMPYGPYLAASTVLVLLFKPLIELGLTRLFNVPPGELPINIP